MTADLAHVPGPPAVVITAKPAAPHRHAVIVAALTDKANPAAMITLRPAHLRAQVVRLAVTTLTAWLNDDGTVRLLEFAGWKLKADHRYWRSSGRRYIGRRSWSSVMVTPGGRHRGQHRRRPMDRRRGRPVSGRYNTPEARRKHERASRAGALVANRQPWTCKCGRVVLGNGGASSHRRACPVWTARAGR